MTSQDPRDLRRTSTDLGLFTWGLAALVVGVTIVAILTLVNALIRGPIERPGTGAGPGTTQSAQGHR